MIRYLIATYSLICYVAVRGSSYITSPRPYLWWHFAIDIAVVVVWISALFLFAEFIEKSKRN